MPSFVKTSAFVTKRKLGGGKGLILDFRFWILNSGFWIKHATLITRVTSSSRHRDSLPLRRPLDSELTVSLTKAEKLAFTPLENARRQPHRILTCWD
jgi:hypothetical protein